MWCLCILVVMCYSSVHGISSPGLTREMAARVKDETAQIDHTQPDSYDASRVEVPSSVAQCNGASEQEYLHGVKNAAERAQAVYGRSHDLNGFDKRDPFEAAKFRRESSGVFTTYECEGDDFNMNCQNGQILNIIYANYGRTESQYFGYCFYGIVFNEDTGCYSSASFNKVREMCQGKSSCSMNVANGNLGGDPCIGTSKYLNVTYICEDPPPCSSNPCENGATCTNQGSTYHCHCKIGFSGTNCHTTPCSMAPCLNGGKCQNVGDNFKCLCKPGFKGNTCAERPCDDKPCAFGDERGYCENIPNLDSFRCTCIAGYYGEMCDLVGDCPSPPIVPHAEVVKGDMNIYSYLSEVTYKCSGNSEMIQGSGSIRCGVDGKWNGSVPICWDATAFIDDPNKIWLAGDNNVFLLVQAIYNQTAERFLSSGMLQSLSCAPLLVFMGQLKCILTDQYQEKFQRYFFDSIARVFLNKIVLKNDINVIKSQCMSMIKEFTAPLEKAIMDLNNLSSMFYLPSFKGNVCAFSQVLDILEDSIYDKHSITYKELIANLSSVVYKSLTEIKLKDNMTCSLVAEHTGNMLGDITSSIRQTFKAENVRKVIQNLLKDLSPSIVTLVYKEIMQSSSLSLLSGPFSILERVYSLSTSAPGNEQMFLVALQTYSHFILEYPLETTQRKTIVQSSLLKAKPYLLSNNVDLNSGIQHASAEVISTFIHAFIWYHGQSCQDSREMLHTYYGLKRVQSILLEDTSNEFIKAVTPTLMESHPKLNKKIIKEIEFSLVKELRMYCDLNLTAPQSQDLNSDLLAFKMLLLSEKYESQGFEGLLDEIVLNYETDWIPDESCTFNYQDQVDEIKSQVHGWIEKPSVLRELVDRVLSTCLWTEEGALCANLNSQDKKYAIEMLENNITAFAADRKAQILSELLNTWSGMKKYLAAELAKLLKNQLISRQKQIQHLPIFYSEE